IAAAGNPQFAWHSPGNQQVIAGTGGPLTVAANTPFRDKPPERQVSAFMAGANEAHTNTPTPISRALNSSSPFAVAPAVPSINPTPVPVIPVGNLDYGAAPGAPTPSVVPTAMDIVGLFDSAASRGLLADRARADVYRAHYVALASLNRASARTTTMQTYATTRTAASFLGTNLAAKLSWSTLEETRDYGVDGTTPPQI